MTKNKYYVLYFGEKKDVGEMPFNMDFVGVTESRAKAEQFKDDGGMYLEIDKPTNNKFYYRVTIIEKDKGLQADYAMIVGTSGIERITQHCCVEDSDDEYIPYMEECVYVFAKDEEDAKNKALKLYEKYDEKCDEWQKNMNKRARTWWSDYAEKLWKVSE